MKPTIEESSSRMDKPSFLKLVTISSSGHDEHGVTQYIKVKVCIDPLVISSYVEGVATMDGHTFDVTITYVGGVSYWIDMPFDKFDKLIRSIDRGFSIEQVDSKHEQ